MLSLGTVFASVVVTACAVVVAVVSVVTGVAGDAVVGETGCCGRPASRQLCHPPSWSADEMRPASLCSSRQLSDHFQSNTNQS